MTRLLQCSGTAGVTADSVMAVMVLSPSSRTAPPSSTFTPTIQYQTIGGHILSDPGGTVWHIDDATNFSINASTGEITFINDGHATAVRATNGGVTSNDMTITCASFVGPSVAALAQMEAWRAGLYDSMIPVNVYIPDVVPLNGDVTLDHGIGFAGNQTAIDNGNLSVVDMPDFTYERALDLKIPAAIELPIDHIVRDAVTTQFHLMAGVDANDFAANWWGARNARAGLRHWGSLPTSNFEAFGYADGKPWTIVSSSRIDLGIVGDVCDSTGWPTDPPPGQATLGFQAGFGTAGFSEVPDWTRQSCFGDVEYISMEMKVNAGYKNNNGSGGQKTVENNYTGGQSINGYYALGFQQFPHWGFAESVGQPGYDDGEIALQADSYQLDRYNGADLGSITAREFGYVITPVVRDVKHRVEILHKLPETPGADERAIIYIDGVEKMNVTFRVVDLNMERYQLHRAVHLALGNTWGGGGLLPTADNHNYYGYIFHARGWSIVGAETGISLHVTCEEGDTPPSGQPIHFLCEARDGNGVRIDSMLQGLNPSFGTQQFVMTPSSGSAAMVAMNWSLGPYIFDTATGSGPASGHVRANNATLASVTHVYLSKTDNNSVSRAALGATIQVGQTFRIHASGASWPKWADFTVTSITDSGTSWDLGVTYLAGTNHYVANFLPVDAELSSVYFGTAGGQVGRVRVAVTGASAGPLTFDAVLKEFANNDKWTGRTFVGSKAVNVA
jgi:hypothetical protein